MLFIPLSSTKLARLQPKRAIKLGVGGRYGGAELRSQPEDRKSQPGVTRQSTQRSEA